METRSYPAEYLAFDQLAANPRLARSLPPDVARRFHALPLAEDNGRVTVVMADPNDAVAREAVVSALGPAACVIQGDAAAIDALLAEVWAGVSNDPLDVLICTDPTPMPDEVMGYARALADTLAAHVSYLTEAETPDALVREGRETAYDLIIVENAGHPLVGHWLRPPPARSAEPAVAPHRSKLPSALLAVQQPRWPLERILLVVAGGDSDSAAVDWAVLLARRAGCSVTVLAVVPPVPAMYGCRAGMHQGLPALLTSGTSLGRQMQLVARRLVDSEIDGTLRLREGPPDQQIRREVADGNHDLVVVAAQPCPLWRRWWEGNLTRALLCWANRPVLLARRTTE